MKHLLITGISLLLIANATKAQLFYAANGLNSPTPPNNTVELGGTITKATTLDFTGNSQSTAANFLISKSGVTDKYYFYVDPKGRVGIGTAFYPPFNTTYKLHLATSDNSTTTEAINNRTIAINEMPVVYLPNQTPYFSSLAIGNGLRKLDNTTGTTGNEAKYNTAIGISALTNLTGGYWNTAVGALNSFKMETGIENVAIGTQALQEDIAGSWNVAIGTHALQSNKSSKNIAIGSNAARDLDGSENIIIGNSVGPIAGNAASDNLNIGNSIIGTDLYGTGANCKIGIGYFTSTDLPSQKLDVNGKIRVRGITSGGTPTDLVAVDASGVLYRYNLGSGGGIGSECTTVNSVPRVKTAGSTTLTCGVLYDNGSNVGIGTATPGAKLEINSTTAGTAGLKFTQLTSSSTPTTANGKSLSVDANGNVILVPVNNTSINSVVNTITGDILTTTINNTITSDGVKLHNIYNSDGTIDPLTTTSNTRTVTINDQNIWFKTSAEDAKGQIYIGNNLSQPTLTSSSLPTTSGKYRLYVEGGILTEKIKVAVRNNANWADYVFDKDYTLMPLHKVETYINENKHLPGVPSAEQLVKEGGIDVTAMQAKQMEKIEELTLYIIEQNKMIEKQQAEIEKLQKQNAAIDQLKATVEILLRNAK